MRTLEGAERDAEAARLRSRGLSLRQVADALGYSNESGAYKAVQRALAAVPVEAVEELRRLQLEQLNYLGRRAFEVLEAEHPLISPSGRAVVHNGQPLTDWRPTLRAIDSLLRIMEREAKLMGLDAPQRHPHFTLSTLDLEIARLLNQLGEPPDGVQWRAIADDTAGQDGSEGPSFDGDPSD
jgi:hypothetical protein